VTVVADSSPLVILAKIGSFDLLNRLFPRLFTMKQLQNQARLSAAQGKYALGAGELSTILLAKEIRATEVLLDDYNARKLARAEGLQVRGSVGLLETSYLRGHLADLRAAFRQLLTHSYIDRRLLDLRLRALGLPPL
jgi:predicted nucleic acid-binding protein